MLFGRRERASVWQRFREWLWPSRGWRRASTYIWYRIIRISESPHRIALGIASGVFVSFTPFLGFHFLLAALIALAIQGNIVASAFGTLIGNPITFPVIWVGSYNLGVKLLGRTPVETVVVAWPPDFSGMLFHPSHHAWGDLWAMLEPVLLPMTIGGALLGLVFAALSYYIARIGVAAYQTRRRASRACPRDDERRAVPGGDLDKRQP